MAAANVEGYVNIRSEANADSEIVGVLMPGYAVTVTEKEILFIKCFHRFRWRIHFEFPVSVQIHYKAWRVPISGERLLYRLICTVRRMHRITIFLRYILIFPVSCLSHVLEILLAFAFAFSDRLSSFYPDWCSFFAFLWYNTSVIFRRFMQLSYDSV